LFGTQGVRVGWMVALFMVLAALIIALLGTVTSWFMHSVAHIKNDPNGPITMILGELIQVLGVLGATAVCALIEHRRILDYNLTGPSRLRHFLTGLAAGLVALSALVGALYAGNWIHIGPVALSGVGIYQYGALWGLGFLLVGFAEEGMIRCYMLFTLARGINYWWALGLVGAMSVSGLIFQHGEGIWGVYILTALGLVPCFLLHLQRSPSAGFWQASWVTSTFFGFIHTGNNGETWIGIFSAAAIGFAFCLSIRLTGSIWWAIGFHAAWDWAQTYFYGTADSGYLPLGHFLNTHPTGAVLWSGGTDGPEGSLLVIPTVLLTMAGLLVFYRRKTSFPLESASTAAQAQLS